MIYRDYCGYWQHTSRNRPLEDRAREVDIRGVVGSPTVAPSAYLGLSFQQSMGDLKHVFIAENADRDVRIEHYNHMQARQYFLIVIGSLRLVLLPRQCTTDVAFETTYYGDGTGAPLKLT